ncbi:antitoxin MazE [Jeotgalicoccus meleagridis]|jgi:hypothetical protein|uniref:Uncharacterized protein n=1 Tax=Jeotgalicoccus meleagridis TaxID=2759181 RepID=A0A6V7R7Y7_9STAP|nr:antitoxin MazE [Jeotgalicoccus meleagridis]CAD2073590.1 hypothetical protein JEODO184_00490 [Jeotgalicoccus meleagridis]
MNLSGYSELEKELVVGYLEMAELNLMIARESFSAECEAYHVSLLDLKSNGAACNDRKDGE